jgi:hypothetical protein
LAGAQSNVTGFLQFGQENATTFTGLYLGPMGNSLGNNLNNGWFNTGQAHRLGRFDFRLSIPVTFVVNRKGILPSMNLTSGIFNWLIQMKTRPPHYLERVIMDRQYHILESRCPYRPD